MTPLLTVNLLRVLFVTFCAAIGGMVTVEMQGMATPGVLIGAVFALIIVLADRLLKGFSLRAFSSATFGLLLGLLAVLDDVAGLEENAFGDLSPDRRTPQEKLEVHAEVLELLALRVAHDGPRVGVGLDRQSLLVPADRLGLLGQRRAQPGERPGLRRQLVGRLVVLVEAHVRIVAQVAEQGNGVWRSRHTS